MPCRPLARWSLTLLLLALVALPAASQGRIDVLNNRGQIQPLPGATVLSETLDEVRFSRGASARQETRRTAVVVAIEYGRGSESYEQAQEALARGDLTNAVNLFTAALRDSEPAWVPAHALLGLAETHGRRGPDHARDALSAIDQFLSDHPEHRLLPEALLAEARYASATANTSRAQAAIAKVLDLASQGRITPDWAVRAHLENGQMLLDAGQARDAGVAFGKAESAANGADTGERPDLRPVLESLALQARSGAGAALLAGGDIAGARSYFDRLMQDGGDDPAIRVAALVGQAEADFHDDKLKDAQLAFAKVAVTGAAVPDQHAKALYFMGQCAEALDRSGDERNGRTKALDYYKEVAKRYPGTRWARLAQQSLP